MLQKIAKWRHPSKTHIFGAIFIIVFAAIGTYAFLQSHAASNTATVEPEIGTITSPASSVSDSLASNGQAVKFGTSSTCTISPILVNSCRPWFGGAIGGYTQVASDAETQFNYAESRLNNPNVLTNPSSPTTLTYHLDIFHSYHAVGSNTLSTADIYFATRPNTILYANWKPADPWVNGSGGDAAVNATIKQMADSIKSIAPTKIMLTIYHEPENNVSSGNCTTNASGATSGSPTDYVNMWHNVRSIFDQDGVTNVVWVMNYMGYSAWDCLVPLMWPGNSYVDWVTFDIYGTGSTLFTSSVQRFYNILTADSNATDDFLSKPWGAGEFGYGPGGSSTDANALAYFNDANTAMANNTFPKLKLLDIYDTSTNGQFQIGYNLEGGIDIPRQQAYNTLAQTVFNMHQ